MGTEVVTPPPDPHPWAPGTEITGGAHQSDPFLTTDGFRFLLFTSGSGGPAPMNVPVATSGDFTHWTAPVDALPVLPPWARPGLHVGTGHPPVRFGLRPVLHGRDGRSLARHRVHRQRRSATPPPGRSTPTATPFICQLDKGGSIDPRVFVDDDGSPWMVWKSDQNIGGSDTPTTMWSQRLSADGTHLVGSPSALLGPDEPWQGTIVEAPDLVEVGRHHWVVYSANWFNQPAYGVGAARCAGPAGPCADTVPQPLLASNLQGQGPGEASVFHDSAGYWLLYSPWRSLAPLPDSPRARSYITRIGFGPSGPYLADGPLPSAADLLADPVPTGAP